MSTKNNYKQKQLIDKQNHLKQISTICNQLSFPSKNAKRPEMKISERMKRTSQRRNKYAKLIIKNSFDNSKEKPMDVCNQTEQLDSTRRVLLSNNPSDILNATESNTSKQKRCISLNQTCVSQNLDNMDSFNDYVSKVMLDDGSKNEYVPLDQILQELILTHHQPVQIPNFSSYYTKDIHGKVGALKPHSSNLARRTEKCRKIKKLPNCYNRQKLEDIYDLPYITEKDKAGFLSKKFTLVSRETSKADSLKEKGSNCLRKLIDKTNIVNASIVLPKLCEDDASCFNIEGQDGRSDSSDSKTTYKSHHSDSPETI
eukprot:CAMPEP_0168318434 /NCGR_PEP_ID=MMETSP0213-20121227/481_1 /TAXON_ID=151035 /ORGANISM="Euplotes harpa, Strain FSP1.4" /LENGTH=313 /DNA_ID=CAMNT_0008319509 /DNA_START=430 /DNA_END=1372 /DNA_ORIENTATION=+